MMLICLGWLFLLSTNVWSRLVVDSKEELMIIDGEGAKVLDLLRIVMEGKQISSVRSVDSDCTGMIQENVVFEYFIREGINEAQYTVQIPRGMDDLTVVDAMEPWVVGHVKIR